MWKLIKSDFESLMKKYQAILITLGTGFVYFVATSYQKKYMAYYGVDPSLVGVKLDIDTIATGILWIGVAILLISVVILIADSIANYMMNPKKIGRVIVSDIAITVVAIIYGIFVWRNINSVGAMAGIDETSALIVFSAATIYLTIKLSYMLFRVIEKNETIKNSYKESAKVANKAKYTSSPKLVTWYIVGCVLVLCWAVIPGIGAEIAVSNKKEYPYIVRTQSSNFRDIIVADSSKGFVVVRYNLENFQFEKDFRIVDYKGETISYMWVKPLDTKRTEP